MRGFSAPVPKEVQGLATPFIVLACQPVEYCLLSLGVWCYVICWGVMKPYLRWFHNWFVVRGGGGGGVGK